MRIVPMRPLHLLEIEPQVAQPVGRLLPEHGLALCHGGCAWTGLLDERPVAAAGFLDEGEGRAAAWALLSEEALRHMGLIHRYVLRGLESAGWRRIETAVLVDHEAGHLWARRLGFEPEGIMRAWASNGDDAVRYARVRRG